MTVLLLQHAATDQWMQRNMVKMMTHTWLIRGPLECLFTDIKKKKTHTGAELWWQLNSDPLVLQGELASNQFPMKSKLVCFFGNTMQPSHRKCPLCCHAPHRLWLPTPRYKTHELQGREMGLKKMKVTQVLLGFLRKCSDSLQMIFPTLIFRH